MPNNCLSVLYKHIIQVGNKNVGLKVGGTNIPLPPPPPPPASYASVIHSLQKHQHFILYTFGGMGHKMVYSLLDLKRQQERNDGRKDGNVLFNDALNTFNFTVIWRRIYGKGPLR